MLVMRWEEVLQIKTSTFPWVQFSEKDIYINEEQCGYLIFFIKFNYLIGANILQLVCDFVTHSIVA